MTRNSRRQQQQEADKLAGQAAQRRSLGLIAVLLGASLAIFTGYVVYAAFPGRATSIPLRGGVGRTIDKLLPQGWGFFTKDPEADTYVPYRQVGLNWQSSLDGPLASASNAWGFDRSPRLQDQQVQSVVAGIDPSNWRACAPGTALSAVQTCLEEDDFVVVAHNPWPVPALCGRVAIVTAHEVPWPSAHSGGPVFEATSVLQMDMRC